MNMVNKITLLAVLLFVGCATDNAVFIPAQPSEEKGSVVYVYRVSEFSSMVLVPEIVIQNNRGEQTRIGKLGRGEYKRLYLLPGEYEIQLESIKYYAPGNALAIDIKPGSVNYIQVDASLKFETATHYKAYQRKYDLREISASIALGEIANCIDIDSKALKKNVRLKAGVGATEEVTGSAVNSDKDALFSIDKTADPFSRKQ